MNGRIIRQDGNSRLALPRVGKIKIGMKNEKGLPMSVDYFIPLVGGNKAQKGFKGAGYRKVVIVDSDPDTLVAVRRKDVDLDTKEGREMAMLDNLTTQVNLAWDLRAPFTQGGGLRRGCGIAA